MVKYQRDLQYPFSDRPVRFPDTKFLSPVRRMGFVFAPAPSMRLPMFCLVCKMPGHEPVCAHCFPQLLKMREPTRRHGKIFTSRSLFAWRAASPLALTWLIRSLKRRDQPLSWLPLAACMIAEWGKPSSDSVLVPVPSRRRNHALGLARALGQWTGLEVRELLRPGQAREQKWLSQKERQSLEFQPVKTLLIPKHVLIVDDIITTGATAAAAARALGQPRHCEVWCLMDRRPCGY